MPSTGLTGGSRNRPAVSLRAGELDLTPDVPLGHRLPTLTTVTVPEGVDELGVRKALLDDYGIEIAGGLGAFKGKVWRIGLMGYSTA